MKKSSGRKERRMLARANRRAEGRRKMKRHNWIMKLAAKKGVPFKELYKQKIG